MKAYVTLRTGTLPDLRERIPRLEAWGLTGVMVGDHLFIQAPGQRRSEARRPLEPMTMLATVATLPEVPDAASEEALKGAHGLAGALTVSSSPIKVGTSFCRMSSLCHSYAVQNAVQLAIATAIQTVAHTAGRGGLERRGSRVGSKMSVRREAHSWSEDPGECSCCQQVDAA